MHDILEKLLWKRGIKDVVELQPEERVTFDMYQKVLSKKEMTLGDLKEFVGARIAHIEMRWADMTLDSARKAELIPYHTVYKMIFQAIGAPQLERDALERALITQLN
jgi:hypothetical protein